MPLPRYHAKRKARGQASCNGRPGAEWRRPARVKRSRPGAALTAPGRLSRRGSPPDSEFNPFIRLDAQKRTARTQPRLCSGCREPLRIIRGKAHVFRGGRKAALGARRGGALPGPCGYGLCSARFRPHRACRPAGSAGPCCEGGPPTVPRRSPRSVPGVQGWGHGFHSCGAAFG